MRVLHVARRIVSPDLRELRVGYDLKHFYALSRFLEENHVLLQSADGRPHHVKLGRLHVHLAPSLPALLLYAMVLAPRCHLIVAQNPFIAGLIAVVAGLVARRPVLISVHGYLFTVSYPQFMLRRAVCLAARAVRANSLAVAKMLESWGVPRSKIHVVGDRVDVDMFSPRVDGSKVRRRHGLEGHRVVLYVGSLTRIKGVDLLLRALRLVAEEVPDVKLVILGDGPLRGRLMELARELGVEDRVVFAGQVPHEEVPGYMAASDLLAHPSLSESLGRALLEAQASGRPVVAFKVGGVREAVRDGWTGILVEPGDYRGMAEAIARLLLDEGLRSWMGVEARRFVEERFEFWRQELELARLYWMVVEGSHRGR